MLWRIALLRLKRSVALKSNSFQLGSFAFKHKLFVIPYIKGLANQRGCSTDSSHTFVGQDTDKLDAFLMLIRYEMAFLQPTAWIAIFDPNLPFPPLAESLFVSALKFRSVSLHFGKWEFSGNRKTCTTENCQWIHLGEVGKAEKACSYNSDTFRFTYHFNVWYLGLPLEVSPTQILTQHPVLTLIQHCLAHINQPDVCCSNVKGQWHLRLG